jgi:HEAT repeat protein
MMMEEPIRQEVQRLLDLLRSQASGERIRAARSLKEIAARTHSSTLHTRGAVTRSAVRALPALDLTPALQAIGDTQWEVRREVALTLGEWGDEVALEVLDRLAQNDSEWRVREAVAEALGSIGGPQAVEALTQMVKTDPHPRPAERALRALGDLAVATWPVQLEPQPKESPAALRTRGAVRVRGASPSRHISPEADAILGLLDEIRFRHPDPSVRETAENVLAKLDD